MNPGQARDEAEQGMQDDVLPLIAAFAGPARWLQVGGVNRQWSTAFRAQGTSTSRRVAIESTALLQLALSAGFRPRIDDMNEAARAGDLPMMIALQAAGCAFDATSCAAAASGGHVECLQWLRQQNCPWDTRTCKGAAGSGHLDCMQYAHEKECPWD